MQKNRTHGGERLGSDPRRWEARIVHEAAATRLAGPSPRLRFRMGHCLYRALCGDVTRLRRLSDRLWFLDGRQAVALPGTVRGSALRTDGGHDRALRRHRCEPENVSGLVVVRLFHTPRMVDQGDIGHLRSAMVAVGYSNVYLVSLDGDWSGRISRQPVTGAVRCRRSNVVQ